MTLAEFLLARIAEDERNCATNGEPEDWCDRAEGDHYDSKRILAEVAAKRAVLDLLDIAQQNFRSIHLGAADYADVQRPQVPRDALLRAVQALALPYADHPDYDDAWRLA